MKPYMKAAAPLLIFATGLSAATYTHDPNVAEEFRQLTVVR